MLRCGRLMLLFVDMYDLDLLEFITVSEVHHLHYIICLGCIRLCFPVLNLNLLFVIFCSVGSFYVVL